MIIASNNKNKISQIKNILNIPNLISMKEAGFNKEIVEDEKTIEGNAKKKALEIFKHCKDEVIADDTGLCIDIFDGWPGVNTHRFLGDKSTSEERNTFILEKMKNIAYEQRTAKVVCVIAYVDIKGRVYLFKSEYPTYISEKAMGDNKFGFDEIIEYKKGVTFAMLDDKTKESVNMRSIALTKFKKALYPEYM